MAFAGGILAQILAEKRREVAAFDRGWRGGPPVHRPRVDFVAALRRREPDGIRAIAEIKRASPSAGPIRPDADPAAVAREYVASGAAALSVLTDRRFFGGSLDDLRAARAAVGVPILRKDFIIDERQVAQAAEAGADAVLLIVAALPGARLEKLLAEVRAWGLEALVEVHDLEEAERAVAVGAAVIGVNHRDLATFAVDMTLTAQIRTRVPPDRVLVAESGIKTAHDVQALAKAGADAILVGEALMRQPSPGAALRELLGS